MQYSGWLGDAAAASVMRAAKEKKLYSGNQNEGPKDMVFAGLVS